MLGYEYINAFFLFSVRFSILYPQKCSKDMPNACGDVEICMQVLREYS